MELNIPEDTASDIILPFKPKPYSLDDLWGERENRKQHRFAKMRI